MTEPPGSAPRDDPPEPSRAPESSGAPRPPAPLLVALGILASRLAGLGRETAASRLLGNSAAADALAAAMRIPNLLQNLLGDGVISASFVPVYSLMLSRTRSPAEGETGDPGSEASRTAGAVAGLLMTVTGAGVLLIITLAHPITLLLAPGLSAERFESAVSLTRITAVGAGFAVMSAWCLGVLSSHRRFFAAYAAPVLWNAAQIGALTAAWILAFDLDGTARALAWGAAVGGLAQVLFQLPLTLRLARGVRLNWGRHLDSMREIRRRFGPAVLGRGAMQLTSYLELVLASLLATGALAALSRAQILYMLPISLFAMSVAAAELPEMSRLAGEPSALAARSEAGSRKVAFWLLLMSTLYIAAGDLIVGLLFEGGRFSAADTRMLWLVIGVYGLALPATGVSRVLLNTCYAAGDTIGPARIAATRVAVSAALGAVLMFPLDRVIAAPDGLRNIADALRPAWALPTAERELADTVRLGAVGLAAGSAVAAWTELVLLARLLKLKSGGTGMRVASVMAGPTGAAAVACVAASAVRMLVGPWPAIVSAPLVLGVCACAYTATARLSGVRESDLLLNPARRAVRTLGRRLR